jgi:hypothetical protein
VSRAASFAVLTLGAAAVGGLCAVARTPASGPTAAAIEGAVAAIDARLREAAAAARSRAQTLAELPRLALAVATDRATVRDLTGEELAFRPGADETIEIAQLPRPAGAPVSLLRVPDGSSAAIPLDSPGVHLVRAGASLQVAAVVRVVPAARADELDGVVAIARPPDLEAVTASLGPLGGGARIEARGVAVAIGAPLAPGRPTRAIELPGELGRGARLVIAAPGEGRWRGGWIALAVAIAAATLAAAARLWRRPRPRELALADQPSWSSPRWSSEPIAEATAEPTEPPTAIATLLPYRSPSPRPPARFGLGSQGDVADGSAVDGRYTLLRLLGSGAMAHVYLARERGDAGFERLVAIKVMRDVHAADPRLVDLFLDEARLACQLRHPNIVAVTDLVRTGGEYLIVMEYVEGADLRRLIRRVAARQERIPVPLALTMARRLCDGLHHAHNALDPHGEPFGLVHRDVKAANVIVSLTGSVKIGDFGVARVAGRSRASTTAIGQVKGTPAYMAPEQSTGAVVDRRADVYALGAVAYEVLTGCHINLDPGRIGHLGPRGWPHLPPPSAVRPELPPELDGVIMAAMAFEPGDRQPDCERLELALADVARQRGLSADDKDIARWLTEVLAAP